MKARIEYFSDRDGSKQTFETDLDAVPARGDHVIAEGRSRQLKRVTFDVVDEPADQVVVIELY